MGDQQETWSVRNFARLVGEAPINADQPPFPALVWYIPRHRFFNNPSCFVSVMSANGDQLQFLYLVKLYFFLFEYTSL